MKKLVTNEKKATQKQIDTIVNSDLNKSKKMIALFEIGVEIKTISELLTTYENKLVRYNFVYNVISNYVNMNGVVLEETNKESKKDKIIEMYLQNKSTKEISIELKTNSNYVYNTIKQYKQKNETTNTNVAMN